MTDTLGDRMKRYENQYRNTLMHRMPAIIRVDGKAFHTFTRNMDKPFDINMVCCMQATAKSLVKNIQNARLAYVQSDEISILLVDYNTYTSQQWFDGNINKIVSISAAMASTSFSLSIGRTALFDSRVFSITENEVNNYFIWRQQDAVRNSIQSTAQSIFSPKELHGKSCNELQDMIFKKSGKNWNDLPANLKRGAFFSADGTLHTPDVSKEKDFIKQYLQVEEK
jgi:tRNA(His) guanylyltransferase